MKNLLRILLVVFAVSPTFGQIPPGRELRKKQPSLYSFIKMTNNKQLRETEVTCNDWNDYLLWLKYTGNEAEYEAAQPEMNERNKHYFEEGDEKYWDIPITGISYEQATRYCEWLTRHYNCTGNATWGFRDIANETNICWEKEQSSVLYRVKKRYQNIKDMPYRYEFRLPSIEEWKECAELGIHKNPIFAEPMRKGYNIKGCVMLNFKVDSTQVCYKYKQSKQSEYYQGLTYVQHFFSDAAGIYNMQGNVAEMTTTKGVACGGSYKDPIEDCQIHSTSTYTKSEDWLGFRVIAEFIPLISK